MQEYWSGLPCLPPGDLPNPGMAPWSPVLQMDSLPSEQPGKHCKVIALGKTLHHSRVIVISHKKGAFLTLLKY